MDMHGALTSCGSGLEATGARSKVTEFQSKRISDFRQRLHISFITLHQNTGVTSANCRIKWGVTILLLSSGRPCTINKQRLICVLCLQPKLSINIHESDVRCIELAVDAGGSGGG